MERVGGHVPSLSPACQLEREHQVCRLRRAERVHRVEALAVQQAADVDSGRRRRRHRENRTGTDLSWLVVSVQRGYPGWIDSGAAFIEIDVRRNSDGVYVISHDDPQPGEEHPTLEDVLAAASGRVGIHLDLKETGD